MERIFLATLGKAPAVVTETLWALKARSTPWIPDRVELVTTVDGAAAIAAALLVPGGPLTTLYPAPGTCPPVTVFVPLRDAASDRIRSLRLLWDPASGQTLPDGPLSAGLADVDDAEAASCMGDLILARVHAACRHPGNQLHLSISGGRKTMAAHALFSLGLVGNPQDEASHVLMPAEFENNRQFWHPDQGGLINTAAEQRQLAERRIAALPPPALDPRAAAAGLNLFAIAAPSYDFLPRELRQGDALPRLSTIIRQQNLAGEWARNPRIAIDIGANAVTLAGETRILDEMDFVWLRLLATAAHEGWTSLLDSPQHPPGALTVARVLFGRPGHGNLLRLRQWFDQALAAGLARKGAAERSAKRTDSLAQDQGADGAGLDNLRSDIDRWLGELHAVSGRSARAQLSGVEGVNDDLMKRIGSFSKLRAHLAELFGLPLAHALLPKWRPVKARRNGLSQMAYVIPAALPGFLSVSGEER